MRLILVPNTELRKFTEDYEPKIPLGLLSLAVVLSHSEHTSVHVVDPRSIDFQPPKRTAELLLTLDPSVVGFSTMCGTYPHSLRTAQILKSIRPDIPIVFGGPHATAVAKETLNTFSFVDFVLTGECELSIVDFVSYLATHDRGPGDVPGLVFRENGTATQHLCRYPLLPSEELPEIDYSIFHNLRDFRSIPLDVGRGCPFSCTFCTTSVYWERRYRLRSPQYVIDTVRHLKEKHGVTSFNFVHDNFTASPPQVAEFCKQVIASGVSFEWRCSARPDSVDSDLLDLMQAAGCRGMFMGIESGSPRIQKLSRKNARLERVIPAVKRATRQNIALTTSFVLGFPYEEPEDIEKTATMMSMVNYEGRAQCDLQLHLLSPIPGAPLTDEADVEITLDGTISDANGDAAEDLDDVMECWVTQHGKPIFESFYHYVNPHITRQRIIDLRFGLFTLFTHLRLTALALEEVRRNNDFTFASIFTSCEPLEVTSDSTVIFDWCVSSLLHFLQKSSQPWGHSIMAVLDYEEEIYRLRLAGGNRLIECDYDIYEWAETAVTPNSVIGLPRRATSRYFIMGDSKELKIAQLPV